MAMSGGKDDGEPMMEMNTTPLIDVMLVLLIMFIITIPVATHAVNIDLPTPTPPTNVPPLTRYFLSKLKSAIARLLRSPPRCCAASVNDYSPYAGSRLFSCIQ